MPYLTTNENGEFSGSVSGLSAGNKRMEVTFEGDSEYNQSMITRNFVIIDPAINISLTTPSTVIEIGDTAIITASLTKNSLPFVNQEIEYEISDGSTIIDSGSDFTNNAGQITISYTGTGAGDIQITTTYNSLEETISIEDCYAYITTLPAMSQSTLGTGAYKDTFNTPFDLPSEYSIEVNLSLGNQYPFITLMLGEDTSNYYYNGFGNSRQLTMAISRNNNRVSLIDDSQHPGVVTSNFSVSYDGTNHNVIGTSQTITSRNAEYSPSFFLGFIWGRSSTINYIKIKPL